MIRIAIVGAAGRMGTRVIETALTDREFEIVAALTVPSDPRLGQPAIPGGTGLTLAADTEARFDVLIDFSLPEGTMQWLPRCVESNAAMVSGTTGLSEAELATLRAAGRKVPVLWAANFSVGINLLMSQAAAVARELGPDFDIEIVETHHNRKVDAPSGTALRIAESIAGALDVDLGEHAAYGRKGRVGKRPRGEIAIHAVRAGDIVGDHTVIFATQGERIELRHQAHSRENFARGALRAAKFLAGRQAGFYSMKDVLGTND